MRTIPVENAHGQLIVRHPRPRVDRDPDTGKVKFDDQGQPIYFPPQGMRFPDQSYPAFVKKRFVLEHAVGDDGLGRSALVMFMYLTTELRYCTPHIVHGPNGEPLSFEGSNQYVQAYLHGNGSRVPARTIEDLMSGTGFKSPETVERAIRELRRRGIVDDYQPHERTIRRERRSRGRPIKMYHLEINPEYAWSGPMPSSAGYAHHVQTKEPNRFAEKPKARRSANVKE